MTRIVVGFDGSDHAVTALQWAIEEGALRDCTVEAFYIYSPPRRGFSDDLIELPYGGTSLEAIEREDRTHHDLSRGREAQIQAEQELQQWVNRATADSSGPDPELYAIGAGDAAEALIEQTRTADLLVIGTRGLGGLRGALLGSVAHQCIQDSKCPVLIIPPDVD